MLRFIFAVQKRESSKEDRKKKEAEEEASGILNEAGRKLRGSGRWIGDRAETVKDKAGAHFHPASLRTAH